LQREKKILNNEVIEKNYVTVDKFKELSAFLDENGLYDFICK